MYREKEEKVEPGTFAHVVTYLCYSSKIRWFEPAVRFLSTISSSFLFFSRQTHQSTLIMQACWSAPEIKSSFGYIIHIIFPKFLFCCCTRLDTPDQPCHPTCSTRLIYRSRLLVVDPNKPSSRIYESGTSTAQHHTFQAPLSYALISGKTSVASH